MQAPIPANTAKTFILAGNALITIKSLKTSKHFTFLIRKKKQADIWFVSVAYNGNDRYFNYLGCILPDHTFTHTKASKVANDATSFKAFNWSWNNLSSDQIEILHEGRCGRCGRVLTEPDSIKSGFGPFCRSLIN